MAHLLEGKGLRSLPEFRENPFVEKAISDIKTVKKMQFIQPFKRKGNTDSERAEIQMVVGSGTGEVNGHSVFMRYVEVDEEKFAKLYLSQFQHFWELPKSAVRVFGYIMTKMLAKKDTFEFYMDEAQDYTKYKSHHPVNEGLCALIGANIIAKTIRPNKYFINPLVVFNGDRVTYAKTYIKKKQKDDPNQIDMFQKEIEMNTGILTDDENAIYARTRSNDWLDAVSGENQ